MAIIRLQGSREKASHIYYEVDSEDPVLGTGGMGEVRKATLVDELTGVRRPVAVKFLFNDLPQSSIERARREASVQIRNENLVEMLGFIEIQDGTTMRYHVASELLRGVMLFNLLKGETNDAEGNRVDYAAELLRIRLSNPELFAITIAKNILSGLMALHDKGYIHRDLDPSNIMITSDGKIKIIDFGIVRRREDADTGQQLTSVGQFMGKAAYSSPELVLGDTTHQNETTDIYAVGIMLYEFVTGSLPFEGPVNEVLDMQLTEKIPLKNVRSNTLRKIIDKATEKKQGARYGSAAEMRVALEDAERKLKGSSGTNKKTTQGTSARPKENSKSSSPGSGQSVLKGVSKKIGSSDNKRKVIAIMAGAVVLAGIVAGVALISGGDTSGGDVQKSVTSATVEEKAEETVDVGVGSVYELFSREVSRLENSADPDKEIERIRKSLQDGSSAVDAYILGAVASRRPTAISTPVMTRYSGLVKADADFAHECFMRAASIDEEFYPAFYQLGLDFVRGEGTERNDAYASEYMKRGLESAGKAGDNRYVAMFSDAIKKIGL